MDYKNLTSYKILIELGCEEKTGPLMLKKGIVKFSLPHRSSSEAHYHFDPYYLLGNRSFCAKASRNNRASSNDFFMKIPGGDDDYDLAFSAFIVNLFKVKISKESVLNVFVNLTNKDKLKILNKVFGDIDEI